MKPSTLLLLALGGVGLVLLGRSSAAQAAPTPQPQPQPNPFPLPLPPLPFPPSPIPPAPVPAPPVGTAVRVGDSVVVPLAAALSGVPGTPLSVPLQAAAIGGPVNVRVLVSEIGALGLRGTATAYSAGGLWTELATGIPTGYFPASAVQSVILTTT